VRSLSRGTTLENVAVTGVATFMASDANAAEMSAEATTLLSAALRMKPLALTAKSPCVRVT
jgi:hypothetical protein